MGKIEKNIVLIGGGGHALSLLEIENDKILGYISPISSEIGIPWLGTDDKKDSLISLGKEFMVSFVYSGLPYMIKRRDIIQKYELAGASFAKIIANSAIITPSSKIGEGSCIMNGSIINRSKLGKHVIINSGAIVEHDCKVGDNTFIGPGAVIGGFTNIGKDCFIGLGACLKNGITISDGVSVAMGSVVDRNLTEPGIYHGRPLRLHKMKYS